MITRFQPRLITLLMCAIVVLLVLSASAFGQCAMCRTSLAGSNNAFFIRNFNIGVLVLLVPPVTIFCSIFIVLRRHRNADEDEQTESLDRSQKD
jgi:hypothetical protein